MAKWTDGPEYAPVERPEVFVAPEVEPLPEAEAPPPPTDAAPPEVGVPSFSTGTADVPLASIAPPAPPVRDPRAPFDVASTPLTSWAPAALPPGPPPGAAPGMLPLGPTPVADGHAAFPAGPNGVPTAPGAASAWGYAHVPGTQPHPAWAPDQPFPGPAPHPVGHLPAPPPTWPPAQVNAPGFPTAQPAPWQQPPPPAELRPVTLAEMARAVTPGVLICLVVGALVPVLAPPLFWVAQALSSRIEFRRTTIARAFSIGTFAVLGLGLVSMILVDGVFDVFGWYDALLGWAQLANGAMALFTLLTVGDALRRGEQPDPP